MLDFYFKYPGVLRRMRRGPLASDIDDLADEFARLGYTHATARRYLSLLATFSRYAERVGYLRPETVDVVLVERFLQKVRRSASTRSVARSALGHVVRRLARRFSTTVTPAASDNPDDLLLADFGSYLQEVRGLQPRSCEGIVLVARTPTALVPRLAAVSDRQSAPVIAVPRGPAGLDSARRLRDAQTIFETSPGNRSVKVTPLTATIDAGTSDNVGAARGFAFVRNFFLHE
jgi:hypothetical protein